MKLADRMYGDRPYARLLGRAVQVDPMKPKLKPPGTQRLTLKCDILLSNCAFKFNLRRYTKVGVEEHVKDTSFQWAY